MEMENNTSRGQNAREIINITEDELSSLRERIRPYLTDKRYLHTLAVEREVSALGDMFLPEKKGKLRCAALLHDITKMLSFEKQLQYCKYFGIIVRNSDVLSPKVFHAKTACGVAKRDFSEFCDDEILSGVRWHTTGHYGMTLFESLVYLADYIEDTRTFDDCVRLRKFFYDAVSEDGENKTSRMRALVCTMVKSFDMTIENLISEGAFIDGDTVGARNYFLELIQTKKENELK